MAKFTTVILILLLSGCSHPERSRKALLDAGYTEVTTSGHVFFECGGGDHYTTPFTAKNPVGRKVSGVVCCGWMKGCTIRH